MMMSNSYYEDYLEKTNGNLRESKLLQQEKKAPTSKKTIVLIVLFIVLVGEGFYLWQKNQATQTNVDNPTEALLPMTKPEQKIIEVQETEENTSLITILPTKIVEDNITVNTLLPRKEMIEEVKVIPTLIEINTSKTHINPPKEKNVTQKVLPKIKAKILETNTTITEVLPLKVQEKNISVEIKPTKTLSTQHSLEIALLNALEKRKHYEENRGDEKVDTFNKIILDRSITEPRPIEKALLTIIEALELRQLEKKATETSQKKITEAKIIKKTYTKSLKKEAKVRKEEMRYVTVKSGDSLYRIAKRIYGDASKFELIFKANSDILKKKTDLKIGQKLRVPKLKKAQ